MGSERKKRGGRRKSILCWTKESCYKLTTVHVLVKIPPFKPLEKKRFFLFLLLKKTVIKVFKNALFFKWLLL